MTQNYIVKYKQDDSAYLEHFGVKGQKWGERHYQNPDGTWTELGKKRRRTGDSKYEVRRQRTQKAKKLLTDVGKYAAKTALKTAVTVGTVAIGANVCASLMGIPSIASTARTASNIYETGVLGSTFYRTASGEYVDLYQGDALASLLAALGGKSAHRHSY